MFQNAPFIRKSAVNELLSVIKGPFGFIPTRNGLISYLKDFDLQTPVKTDSLISSVFDALHSLAYKRWENNIHRSHKVICLITDQDNLTDKLLGVKFKEFNLYKHLLDLYNKDFLNIVLEYPVRWYIFDAPLIFSANNNTERLTEIHLYIRDKVCDYNYSIPRFNPFESRELYLPFKSYVKHSNLFEHIKQLEKKKDLSISSSKNED